ncbi:cell division cycle-associated protein 3 isoform X1 [Gadus macrocephalus]|uniref:cell division cycle-associated protein 3 isoform X1 n=1 Tax=Gadus macrocephalus TaxID=80720 RepID=UPI0028CB5150|nr:cell division cycle-associated protein 3 isoform X1 [Gadus macrocephalus]
MGSSESKLSVASTPKPEPEAHRCIQTLRHSEVMDPRSPSTRIDRTPIQVTGPFSKTSVEENNECPQQSFDPRSPTIGVVRTPARNGMRETVDSFACRLGRLFHSEVSDQVPQGNFLPPCLNMEEEEVMEGEGVVGNEQSSGEPLLSRQPSKTLTAMAEHATLLTTPVLPVDCVGSSSPFVILEKAEEEAHMNTEDLSVEEAEEAKESPLHKRLSMSLITCHEGASPAQIFTEVEVHVGPTSPLAKAATTEEHIHSSVVPAVTIDAEAPPCPAQVSSIEVAAVDDAPVVPTSPERPEEAAQAPAGEQPATDAPQCAAATLSLPVASCPAPSRDQPRPCTGIQCPTFDPRSPSQVVFKPQWLGKGFGTAGLRARGVRASKGGSSPLAVRVTVNNVNNENKGKSTKTKQKANGLSEGRSPLQMLKNNSPRDKQSQMRLKASTPERQRPGQVERRALTVALDQENR